MTEKGSISLITGITGQDGSYLSKFLYVYNFTNLCIFLV